MISPFIASIDSDNFDRVSVQLRDPDSSGSNYSFTCGAVPVRVDGNSNPDASGDYVEIDLDNVESFANFINNNQDYEFTWIYAYGAQGLQGDTGFQGNTGPIQPVNTAQFTLDFEETPTGSNGDYIITTGTFSKMNSSGDLQTFSTAGTYLFNNGNMSAIFEAIDADNYTQVKMVIKRQSNDTTAVYDLTAAPTTNDTYTYVIEQAASNPTAGNIGSFVDGETYEFSFIFRITGIGATGAGATGLQGNTGLQGDTGALGNTGIQGNTGLQGPDGPKGDTGFTGNTGVEGPSGFQGQTGFQGNTGPAGSALSFESIDTSDAFVVVNQQGATSVTQVKAISNLPLLDATGGGYEGIPDRLSQQEDLFNVLLEDTQQSKQVKVSFADIAGALTLGLIQANIDAGIGTTATYTGSTDGALVGDFNGDGEINTSDLLYLLANFGSPTTAQNDLYQNTVIGLQAGPNFGPGSNPAAGTTVQIGTANFGSGGAVSASVDQNTDKVAFFSSTDAPLSSFTAKAIKIDPMTILLQTGWQGYAVDVLINMTLLDSDGNQVVSPFNIVLGDEVEPEAEAGTSHNAVMNDNSFTIGGVSNENLPYSVTSVIPDGLGNVNIDKIEMRFLLRDPIGNVQIAAMKPVNINFVPFS